MSVLDELRDAPDLYEAPSDDQSRESWRIDCHGKATWAMRKLRDIATRRAEIRATVEAEIDRLGRWSVTACAPLDRDEAFFKAILEIYAMQVRADSPRDKKGEPTVKFVDTPYGRVQTSVVGGAWKADGSTLEWAKKARPELVKSEMVETFLLGEAKKVDGFTVAGDRVVVASTGEFVPGIAVTPKTVTATVKLVDGVS